MNEDDIASDIKNALSGAAEQAPVENVEVPVETKVSDSTRDELGRFKAKAEEAAPLDKPSEVAPVEATPQEQQAVQAIRPPDTWSVAAKAKFGTLDPEVQKEIMKREQDIFKGLDQYKEGHNFAQNMHKALGPYMATIQSLGTTPEVAVQHLLSMDHNLRYGSPETKLQTLAHIAQTFGVDLSQLTTEQPQVDPTVQALKQELYQIKQHMNTSQTQHVNAEQQYVQSQIEAFKADPKNVYFENVRADMGALMSSGRAKDLQDAYEQACWAHPQVREVLLQQQNQEAEKKRLQEAAQKAEAAKKASFNVQGTGSVQPSGKELTIEEQLRQYF